MTLQELLERKGVPLLLQTGHHHCRPGWIQMDCPFCGPGMQRYHLGYNIQRRYFNCWRCGYHSTLKTLRALGISHEEATQFLSEQEESSLAPPPQEKKPGRPCLLPPGVGPLLPPHKRYLISRGFWPDEIVETWNVQGIGIAQRLSWRLFIPIYHKGRLVSWTTRSISDEVEMRYISASAQEEVVAHKHLVYGADLCSHTVVVVEGPIDAWRIGPGAGALFGTAFTAAQVRRLAHIPRRFICFDSEPKAQEQAQRLADQLACFPGLVEIVRLEAPDPGSASPREIKKLRRYAGLVYA